MDIQQKPDFSMLFKRLTLAARLLIFSALPFSAMAIADLDDLPSDCKKFHHRDISGMPITSSDKTGYFYKISKPEDRRKSKGMGDVFYTLLQDSETDYIHPASSILLTAPELSFHLVGEGQYCRINLGKRWLEYDGVFALLDDATYKLFHRMFNIRQTQNSGQPAEANAYAAVEPYIREMLAKKLPKTVQDFYHENVEELTQDQQDASAEQATFFPESEEITTPDITGEVSGIVKVDTDKTDQTNQNVTSNAPKQQTVIMNQTPNHAYSKTTELEVEKPDTVFYFEPIQLTSATANTDSHSSVLRWVYQGVLGSLTLLMGLLGFILWKIIKQAA